MNNFFQTVINVERKIFLQPIAKVSEKEMLTFLALIIAATQYNVHGKPLCQKDNKNRRAFTGAPDFGQYMNFTRFCEMKELVPLMMVSDKGNDGSDPWWKHRRFIDGFNKKRHKILVASRVKVLDTTMRALRPRCVTVL